MKLRKKEDIFKIIIEHKSLKVSDLEKIVGVPRTTLLRYLKEMVDSGKIIKTFGEVSIRESHIESFAIPRLKSNVKTKKAIANKAKEKIRDGDVIFVDGGSTTYQLLKILYDMNITIYTNNLLILEFINEKYKPNVHFISGRVNKKTLAIASSESIFNIKNLIFDKSFLGFNSLVKKGYSTTNESESVLKRIVIEQTSNQVYAIGRANKSEKTSNYFFANTKEMEVL